MKQTAPVNWDGDLDELDQKLLVALANWHPKAVEPERLVRSIQSDRLRVDSSLSKLERNGLVDVSHNYIYGPSYSLTESGRDLLIEEGIV